jgi:DNA-binding LacI/PurR family transcriptional regulator
VKWAHVGFDDLEGGRFSTLTLSTVAPDKAAVAKPAVELLQRGGTRALIQKPKAARPPTG